MTHSSMWRLLAASLLVMMSGCGIGDRMTGFLRSHNFLESPDRDPARERERLRGRRQLAWAEVHAGHRRIDYTADDARALSRAERALDAQPAWSAAPVANRATFADL